MIQACVCLECIQEKFLDAFVSAELVLNISIQTILLVDGRIVRHIVQHIIKLHTRLVQIFVNIFRCVRSILKIHNRRLTHHLRVA